ncbi:hypothetical protein MKW94_023203 [Papaver nudicaule]|uniref:Uncharacterized protein n=1 Tax=Papaver nudicaule TaxID=74823 RepID=A0AA41V7J2_PAPNU|nr:hypothetical protein [Papaver nudicaule]
MAGAMVRFSACTLLLSTMVLAVMAAQPYPKHPVPNKKSKCIKFYKGNVLLIVSPASLFAVTVCQDPRFIGGDGITFYFHGKKDHDFCLVPDSNLHINAHFTWVQSIGAIFDSHKLYIGALKTSTWDDSVDRLDITVDVEGNFKITANVVPITEEESHCFAHLELGFKFYSLSKEVNGVLGQTYGQDYTSKVNMSAMMPVMGGTHKFLNYALFSTDYSVSRFGFGGIVPVTAGSEFAGLECGSSMEGRGIVCKK